MPYIEFAGHPAVSYEIYRSARAKRLSIEVHPQGVRVTAPTLSTMAQINALVQAKQAWIRAKIAQWQASVRVLPPWPTQWYSGVSVGYLGEKLTLQVSWQPIADYCCQVQGQQLQVGIPQHWPLLESEELEALVLIWLKQQAKRYVETAIAFYCPQLGRWPRQVKLRRPKRRWGSCGIHNDIYINWALILAPLAVLNYVVLHELGHLWYRGHGTRFWQLICRWMPDYKVQERWLSEHGWSIQLPTLSRDNKPTKVR